MLRIGGSAWKRWVDRMLSAIHWAYAKSVPKVLSVFACGHRKGARWILPPWRRSAPPGKQVARSSAADEL